MNVVDFRAARVRAIYRHIPGDGIMHRCAEAAHRGAFVRRGAGQAGRNGISNVPLHAVEALAWKISHVAALNPLRKRRQRMAGLHVPSVLRWRARSARSFVVATTSTASV